ncbi:MAG TPA: hypothetical protein VMU84_12055 [Thermoanaerobaculia bacterium]|nr:hypothetical protein [Thermoanaerobaculia bacterium]
MAGAVAMLISTSAFAETRHQNETWRDANDRQENRNDRGSYRENQRITGEGRIQSLNRERDGYRVQLDRGGYSYWVPANSIRNHERDFRVGASIRFGGVFRGGAIFVDAVTWPNGGYYDRNDRNDRNYDNSYLSGRVDRVDYRRGVLVVRDARSGRFITVDIDRRGRGRSLGLEDVRRGDAITLSGQWLRGDVFEAYRVESIRNGRR